MGSGSPQRLLNERIPFGMLTQILGRRYEWNQRASSGFNGQPDTVIWRGYCAHVPSPWVKCRLTQRISRPFDGSAAVAHRTGA